MVEETSICTRCQGTGKVELEVRSWQPGDGSRKVPCSICDGKGFIKRSTDVMIDRNYLCTRCQGTGKIELEVRNWLPGGGIRVVQCSMCNGKGFIKINKEK